MYLSWVFISVLVFPLPCVAGRLPSKQNPPRFFPVEPGLPSEKWSINSRDPDLDLDQKDAAGWCQRFFVKVPFFLTPKKQKNDDFFPNLRAFNQDGRKNDVWKMLLMYVQNDRYLWRNHSFKNLWFYIWLVPFLSKIDCKWTQWDGPALKTFFWCDHKSSFQRAPCFVFDGTRTFRSFSRTFSLQAQSWKLTLPPTIMEVENGSQQD